mmetsp:Transcript_125313/g.359992  ORF Transcript_125313/g.359992 Transcript_125313/m.359992 type:complete len:234 (-) Transcript_125313:1117-1818(-)
MSDAVGGEPLVTILNRIAVSCLARFASVLLQPSAGGMQQTSVARGQSDIVIFMDELKVHIGRRHPVLKRQNRHGKWGGQGEGQRFPWPCWPCVRGVPGIAVQPAQHRLEAFEETIFLQVAPHRLAQSTQDAQGRGDLGVPCQQGANLSSVRRARFRHAPWRLHAPVRGQRRAQPDGTASGLRQKQSEGAASGNVVATQAFRRTARKPPDAKVRDVLRGAVVSCGDVAVTHHPR